MDRLRKNIFHVATVMGYMWTGWLCAVDERWYWIIAVLLLSTVVHVYGIHTEVNDAVSGVVDKEKTND